MLSMMSASTVDAAVERTCVGNTHGPHRPVSAISRGRWGRWWRAAARTAAAGAALRNAREDSVWVIYGFYLGLAVVPVRGVATNISFAFCFWSCNGTAAVSTPTPPNRTR